MTKNASVTKELIIAYNAIQRAKVKIDRTENYNSLICEREMTDMERRLERLISSDIPTKPEYLEDESVLEHMVDDNE